MQDWERGLKMTALRVCKLLWTAWIVIWMLWALGAKPTRQRLDFGRALSYMIPLLGWYLVFVDPEKLRFFTHGNGVISEPAWTMTLGVMLTAAGLLVAIWARLYLGRNWSGTVTVKVGHQLVCVGPYRFVRHPIYSGLLLALVGTALCRRHLWAFAGVALVWLGFWIKSRLEEQFMVQTFGAAYEDYRRSTGALLPRLL